MPYQILGDDVSHLIDALADNGSMGLDLSALRRSGSPTPQTIQTATSRSGGGGVSGRQILDAINALRLGAAGSVSRPVVTEDVPTIGRKQHLNFVNAAVGAGAQVAVTANPQVVFKPIRLAIDDAFAPSFSLDDVTIGQFSQLVAAGAGGPATAFAASAVGTEVDWDTCQISMQIVLRVTNLTAGILPFRASMFGIAVRAAQ